MNYQISFKDYLTEYKLTCQDSRGSTFGYAFTYIPSSSNDEYKNCDENITTLDLNTGEIFSYK